ncbi:GNAT family N-acetyltransferase [Thermoproteota archaeon]
MRSNPRAQTIESEAPAERIVKREDLSVDGALLALSIKLINNIMIKQLKDNLHFIDIFLDDIERLWFLKGYSPGIKEALINKLANVYSGKIPGIMLFRDNAPIAFAWVDKITENYGNMILHCLEIEDQALLADSLVKTGLLNEALLEMIHFHEGSEAYCHAFRSAGLLENKRQRMGRLLETPINPPLLPPHLKLESLTKEHIPISSEISFKAHQISKDYKGYKDLETLEARIQLEKHIFNKTYGPFIKDASLILSHSDTYVGACPIVEIACWGYDKVPWIFDMTIAPEFQKQGLGRILFTHCLDKLQKLGYPVVGLAVTCNNTRAINLYESLDFEVVEIFYEYAKP